MSIFGKLNQIKKTDIHTLTIYDKRTEPMSWTHANFPAGRQTNTCYCAQFILCNTYFQLKGLEISFRDNKLKAFQEAHPTGNLDRDTGSPQHVQGTLLPTQTSVTQSSFISFQHCQNLAKPPWKDWRLINKTFVNNASFIVFQFHLRILKM